MFVLLVEGWVCGLEDKHGLGEENLDLVGVHQEVLGLVFQQLLRRVVQQIYYFVLVVVNRNVVDLLYQLFPCNNPD